jgi:hypothetical protein
LARAAALGKPQRIAANDVEAQSIQTGIDRNGNGVILWNDWSGNNASGIFAAIHHS